MLNIILIFIYRQKHQLNADALELLNIL